MVRLVFTQLLLIFSLLFFRYGVLTRYVYILEIRKYNVVKGMKTKSQVKQRKNKISNSDLFKHTINALHITLKRRTSNNYSIMIINDILKTMKDKFDFLKYVKVIKTGHSEDDDEVLNIKDDLDSIDPAEIGKAIESIIRIASMNMKDKNAGLYVITELKEHIKD